MAIAYFASYDWLSWCPSSRGAVQFSLLRFFEPFLNLSRVVRKPAFCICENKDADQLRGYREADQRLCFRYTDTTIHLLSKSENFKPLAILCGCTDRFVWDQVGNPEDRFSQNEAHLILLHAVHSFEESSWHTLWIFVPCPWFSFATDSETNICMYQSVRNSKLI